ncbi:MAG: hypothetical protein JNM88_08105 [Chitinophagaceae bacterium]|nr:hypothetical protein [Chitinophagaceae bacterium]
MTQQNEHTGITALDAERKKLLQEYDTAVQQMTDDPVKTEHGVACEAHFRTFLENFLPKKYGVTKGYIITPDLEYAGPLEEWDIIIYDAMESPVLFVRQNRDEDEKAGKRGIPVEYVKAVIEVKASFNKVNAEKASTKLNKLGKFIKPHGTGDSRKRDYLQDTFCAFAVFYETKVKDGKDYRDALGKLAPLWVGQDFLFFSEALIIRGQTCPEYSGRISAMYSGADSIEERLVPCCEASSPFENKKMNMNVFVLSCGYGQNSFWSFLLSMIHKLNGENPDYEYVPQPSTLTGGYGYRKGSELTRLFPNGAGH